MVRPLLIVPPMRSSLRTGIALFALFFASFAGADAARLHDYTRSANHAAISPQTRASPRPPQRGLVLPPRVQDGPTCGLYALGMVMDHYHLQDPRNATVLVQASDHTRRGSHAVAPTRPELLLPTARSLGYTTQGEMFYADQLAGLARHFGYRATVTPNLSLDSIRAALQKGRPPLLGFDVDPSGDPGRFGGLRAHWAVVTGHFVDGGVDYLQAVHAWTGNEYVWRADQLLGSVGQLDRSAFPSAPKDITGTLKGRLVEIY